MNNFPIVCQLFEDALLLKFWCRTWEFGCHEVAYLPMPSKSLMSHEGIWPPPRGGGLDALMPSKSLMSYEGIWPPRGGPASIWPQAPDDKDDQWQMLKTGWLMKHYIAVWVCRQTIHRKNRTETNCTDWFRVDKPYGRQSVRKIGNFWYLIILQLLLVALWVKTFFLNIMILEA